MNRETIMKILAIHAEIECLEAVQKEIEGTKKHCLSYLEYNEGLTLSDRSQWQISDMNKLKFISDILDCHDMQIRQEITQRIEKLNKELEVM